MKRSMKDKLAASLEKLAGSSKELEKQYFSPEQEEKHREALREAFLEIRRRTQ